MIFFILLFNIIGLCAATQKEVVTQKLSYVLIASELYNIILKDNKPPQKPDGTFVYAYIKTPAQHIEKKRRINNQMLPISDQAKLEITEFIFQVFPDDKDNAMKYLEKFIQEEPLHPVSWAKTLEMIDEKYKKKELRQACRDLSIEMPTPQRRARALSFGNLKDLMRQGCAQEPQCAISFEEFLSLSNRDEKDSH